MTQTVLAVVAEIDAASVETLRQRTRCWRTRTIDNQANREALAAAMPTLHFMSLSVFDDPHWDPLLVFESNFDGDPGTFWQSVDRELAAELRPILAYAKDAQTPPYELMFRAGSNQSIAPFLRAHAVRPVAYHVGNVGLTVDRIRREHALMLAVRDVVDAPPPEIRHAGPAAIHAALRARLLGQFPWLAELESRRSPPHVRAATLLPIARAAVVADAVAVLAALLVWPLATVLVIACLAAVILLPLAAAARQLRRLEETDFVHESPQPRPDETDIALRENLAPCQNHLASMVLVKPGALRAILIRLAATVLGIQVLAKRPDGYLGQMRTIHFAHWSLLANGSRMLFVSNYDGSWENYLSDFIDKAASGLTLAWSNCIGFPRTRWLIEGGAADGPRFKAWARHSQRESLFWFSAYPELTVNQIERNAEVAEKLRRPGLSPQEAEQWVKLL